jgi:type IV secretory pathway VirB3-like protein
MAVGTLLTLLLLCWAIVLTVTVAVWTAGAIILTIQAAAHLGRRTWALIDRRFGRLSFPRAAKRS